MSLLDGKVAVVTGAGRGLGRCHALELARQGANVVVNDLGTEISGEGQDRQPAQEVVDEIEDFGGEARAHYGDVTDEEDVDEMVRVALDEFGDLDILVNNAGILRDGMSFNLSTDDWDSVIHVHLRGHFLPARRAARYWRSQYKETDQPQNGSIVLTSSRSGLFGYLGQLNYAAAKSGIASMAVVLARELQKYGVRTNAIVPIARTRLTESTPGIETDPDMDFDYMAPENVSPLVAYLGSDASREVSGQVLLAGGEVVQWMEGWTPRGEIRAGNQTWDPQELAEEADRLFGDAETGPPGVPDLDLYTE